MHISVYLIRHGKTQGNLEGRYIGRNTDEDLCEMGISQLKGLLGKYESLNRDEVKVYSGPMKRAVQTAEILFIGRDISLVDNLTEIDFGTFENKNYTELNGNVDYQSWIDSGGTSDYPGGESRDDFIKRSLQGLRTVITDMESSNYMEAAIVCHGGNIMAIMSELTGENYFDFQTGNAEGYRIELNVEGAEIDLISYNSI